MNETKRKSRRKDGTSLRGGKGESALCEDRQPVAIASRRGADDTRKRTTGGMGEVVELWWRVPEAPQKYKVGPTKSGRTCSGGMFVMDEAADRGGEEGQAQGRNRTRKFHHQVAIIATVDYSEGGAKEEKAGESQSHRVTRFDPRNAALRHHSSLLLPLLFATCSALRSMPTRPTPCARYAGDLLALASHFPLCLPCILAHAPFFAVAKASIQFLLDVDPTGLSNGSNSSNGARTKHTARKKTLMLLSIDDARAEYWARSGGPLAFALARMLRGELAYLSELTREHQEAERARRRGISGEQGERHEASCGVALLASVLRARRLVLRFCAPTLRFPAGSSAESDHEFYTSHKPASSLAAVPTSMSVLVSGCASRSHFELAAGLSAASFSPYSFRLCKSKSNCYPTSKSQASKVESELNPTPRSVRARQSESASAPAWLACVDAVDEGKAQHQQQIRFRIQTQLVRCRSILLQIQL
ncbi:hypothetical protein C8R45DRAFT_929025 [Mycena sanguinolenta]|nr:hypothetical protein C8R45DRAFT_929025 [Mycena sanguinolenta]